MEPLRISDIHIIQISPRDGLCAFCSFVVNESIFIGDVAIKTSRTPGEYRLSYPIKRLATGIEIRYAYPINGDAEKQIREAIVKEYSKVVRDLETTMLSEDRL